MHFVGVEKSLSDCGNKNAYVRHGAKKGGKGMSDTTKFDEGILSRLLDLFVSRPESTGAQANCEVKNTQKPPLMLHLKFPWGNI